MQVTSTLLALLLPATGALVNASPVDPRTNSKGECSVVKVVLDVLNVYKLATPFCSSYLHIPTVTKTSSVVTTVPTTVTKIKVTGTNTITAPTSTSTSTTTTTVTKCHKGRQQHQGRGSGGNGDIPPALASYKSDQISTACSCLSIPTPTTTITGTSTALTTVTKKVKTAATTTTTPLKVVTATATKTVYSCEPAKPTDCSNAGFQWAEFANPDTTHWAQESTYQDFHPAVFKTLAPTTQGVTAAIGLSTSGGPTSTAYDSSTPWRSDFSVINHQGYLLAPQSGTYTIAVSDVDDQVFAWTGGKAYAAWDRGNADLSVSRFSEGQGGSFSFWVRKGEYTAVRVLYTNAQGQGQFKVKITGPGGVVPGFVQFSCGTDKAPKFPAWGGSGVKTGETTVA